MIAKTPDSAEKEVAGADNPAAMHHAVNPQKDNAGKTSAEAAEKSNLRKTLDALDDAAGISFLWDHTKPEEKRKTPGEKFYDILQLSVGKFTIMAATAGIAYVSRYGPDKIAGMPNYLKSFQNWFHDTLLHNKAFPLAQKGEFAKRFAGAAAGTMLLCHGGNVFAPIMKWLENSHFDIAHWGNKRWGTQEDVEKADERLKDKAKQSWGDVIKGRLSAWGLIFGSMVAIDTALGKDRRGVYLFDKYEEWFGRWVAGFTKSGKELSKVPINTALTEAQAMNKTYRFGRILALDLFATTAGIIIWTAISRSSAARRRVQETLGDEEFDHPLGLIDLSPHITHKEKKPETNAAPGETLSAEQPEKEKRFADDFVKRAVITGPRSQPLTFQEMLDEAKTAGDPSFSLGA